MAQPGPGLYPGSNVTSQQYPGYYTQQPFQTPTQAPTPQQGAATQSSNATLPLTASAIGTSNAPAVADEPPKALGFWERVFGGARKYLLMPNTFGKLGLNRRQEAACQDC